MLSWYHCVYDDATHALMGGRERTLRGAVPVAVTPSHPCPVERTHGLWLHSGGVGVGSFEQYAAGLVLHLGSEYPPPNFAVRRRFLLHRSNPP
eukprot:gene9318-biopygen7681